MQRSINFKDLKTADLIVDCVYAGRTKNEGGVSNFSDDPLSTLLKVGNQGGFRYRGSSKHKNLDYVLLISSLADRDWPDYLDEGSGLFVYFGDNRSPGIGLHDTARNGNGILRQIFEDLHNGSRKKVPPIFIFTKTGTSRDYKFRGLAVPGASGLSQTEDLVAIWKSREDGRFQNYKAIFTILDVPVISRKWINDLEKQTPLSENRPKEWTSWIETGKYTPLIAERTIKERSKDEQLPSQKDDKEIIEAICEYFKTKPHKFEKCAAEIARLMDKNIVSYDLTRPSRDGGRDAVGEYRIGLEDANSINLDFALEAKLYRSENSVGVKETSRLISRIKPRQFGIFVTTSYIGLQAYQEMIEDQHPIILICAIDIVRILKRSGYATRKSVESWLLSEFPIN